MNNSQAYIPPLILALFVALLPHVTALPLWVIAWCVLMWAYMFVSMRLNHPLPGKRSRNMLAVIGIVGLLLTYHTRIDSSAYISLLAVMAAIKPFEVSTHRDRMITVFLAYFVVITSLLKSETLLIAIYMFASVLVTTAVLVRINDPEGRFKEQFRVSAVILAQAVPLMLVLFFLFPRMEGSFVGITPAETGITGFSDTLRPGGVSRLVEDESVAFRVEFDDEIPDPKHLYWRGIVFVHFDGTQWHHEEASAGTSIDDQKPDNTTRYRVILQPHNSRWLFALDYPAKAPNSARIYEDFTVLSKSRVNSTKRYFMESRIRDHTGETRYPLDHYTVLPESGNAESRKLAANFADGAADSGEVVNRALSYLEDRNYIYTLSPPLLGSNAVDDFLFESQSGYCEHYASAFAFLMRAAGLPARVVGGYLGGEINPYGDYLIVRQSYAHAWVEVWDDKKGWFRVDPTLAVAPARLSGGPEGGLSADENRGFIQKNLQPFYGLIQQVRFGWDAFSKNWEALFEGYSYEQQKALLERLGIDFSRRTGPLKLLLAGLFLVSLFFGAYLFIYLRKKAEKPDKVKKRYEQFLKKLSRTGVEKDPATGPFEFAEEAVSARPDLADGIRKITDLYIQLRYSHAPYGDTYYRFEKAVKDFHPSKRVKG